MAYTQYESKPVCLRPHSSCGKGSPNNWRSSRRCKREPYIPLNENHTQPNERKNHGRSEQGSHRSRRDRGEEAQQDRPVRQRS
nr:MAG TPA: hypothetical protein [Caudoviricetes sp.]